MNRLTAWLRDAFGDYFDGDQAILAVRIYWLVLLFDPVGHQVGGPVIYIVSFLGLTSRRLVWNPLLWWAAAISCSAMVIDRWVWVDNHDFLRAYWAISIAVCASTKDPAETLRRNGRLMIGLVFLFTAVWKGILSPDFMDGRFFRMRFLTDPRFAEFGELTGGLSILDHTTNRKLLGEWLKTADAEWTKDMIETYGVRMVASISTWWTIFIESSIAVAFLWPVRHVFSRYRNWTLLVFGASTYALANVEGFGWILCAIGLAQVDPDQPRTRLLYMGVFVLILIYDRVPWVGWLILYTT